MKPGTRVLGVAESYRGDTSTLGGVVMTLAGRVDDFAFGTCTVGGTDATDAIIGMVETLDRPDVPYLLIAGVALAWYNIVDLERIASATDRPTIAVTFEESGGLECAIEDNVEDDHEVADRLERYRRLPERREVVIDGSTLYVRAVGCQPTTTDDLLDACTSASRPEPLRVAHLAARAVDRY